MLTERDIEKRHQIDMVCGNIKGNVNSTYTFVAGRLPWVPEPQNLNERKLVRGKERRKKGGKEELSFLIFFFLLFFGSGTQGTGRSTSKLHGKSSASKNEEISKR